MKKIFLLLVLLVLIFPVSAATQLTNYASSSTYGYAMRGLAFDDKYVYYSGETDQTIHKVYKNNMTQLNASATFGATVYDMKYYNGYLYVAASSYIYKCSPTTFTKSYTSASYSTIRAFDISGNYIYAVGNGQTVRKYNLADGTTSTSSVSTGQTLHTVVCDDTYVYAAGANGYVYKYDQATLTLQQTSSSYGGIIYSLSEYGNYVYAGGATTCTINKYDKENLNLQDSSVSFGGSIYAMDINKDGSQIAVGGGTISTVKVYDIATMDYSHAGSAATLTYSIKYDDNLLYGGHSSSTGKCRAYTTYAYDTNTYTNVLTTTAQITSDNEGYGYSDNIYQTGLFAEYVSPEISAPSGSTFTVTHSIPIISGSILNGSINFGIIDVGTNKWITASDTRTFTNSIYNNLRYSFDEDDGQTTVRNLWRHDTGTEGDLTLTGSYDFADDGAANSNGYMVFDGADDYGIATVPLKDWEATDNTMSCMVYLRNTGTGQTLMSLHSTTSSAVLEVQYNSGGTFGILGRNTAGDVTINAVSSGTYTAAGWYHVVLTDDNGLMTLYINKAQVAQGTISTGTHTYDRVMIGGVWWAGACYGDSTEIIDEFHVYDTCLTTSQIATEYDFDFNEVASSADVIASSYIIYPTEEKIRVQFSSYRHTGTITISDFGVSTFANVDPLYNYISPQTTTRSCNPPLSLSILNNAAHEPTNVTIYIDSSQYKSYYVDSGIIDFSEASYFLSNGTHTWYAKISDAWSGTINSPTQTITVYKGGTQLTNINTDTAAFNNGQTYGFTTTSDKLALSTSTAFGYYLSQTSSNVLSARYNSSNSVYNSAMDVGILRYINGQWQWVQSTDFREYGGAVRYSMDEYDLSIRDHWGKNTSDLTNGANHGTTFSTDGKYAGAIYFDGETDYVSTTYNFANKDKFSFGGWTKLDSTISDGDSYFIVGEYPEVYIEYYQNSDYIVLWSKDDLGTMNGIGYSLDLDDAAWHHLFVTYDSGTLRLYVDGVLRGTRHTNGLLDTPTYYLQLGSSSDTGAVSSPKGYMDDIRVYETELTQKQITDIYTDSEPSYYSVGSEEHLDVFDEEFTTSKSVICISRVYNTATVEVSQDMVYVYDDYPFFTAISPNNVSLSSQSVTLSTTVEDNNIVEEDFIRGYFMMDGVDLGIGTDRTTNGSFTKIPTVTGGIYSWITATTDLWLGGSGWTPNMYFDTPLTITNTTGSNFVRFQWNEATPSTDYFNVYINGTLRYTGSNNYYNNTQYFGTNNDCIVNVVAVNSSYTGQDNFQTASLIEASPVLSSIQDTFNVYEGQYFTVSPSATDANNDVITFSDNCALFNINSTTGYVNYLSTSSDVGTYNFNITVTDDTGRTDYEAITLNILDYQLSIDTLTVSPQLNLTRFAPYTIQSTITNTTPLITSYAKVTGINGDGSSYIDYYVNGTSVLKTTNLNLTYSGGELTSTSLYPDNIYPEIYFQPSTVTWYKTPSDSLTYRHNYQVMDFQNPFTMDSNMSLFIEINAVPVSGTTSVPLEVYLVSKEADLSYFESNWLTGQYTTLAGTISRTDAYHHTHNANATHYLIPLTTNATGKINGLNIDDEFYIVLYANTVTSGKGWNVKYITNPSTSWYSADRVSTNSWSAPVQQSGSPAVHVHVARNEAIDDGVNIDLTLRTAQSSVTDSQNVYFGEIPNMAPTSSIFTSPTNATYSGTFNIEWEPSNDANNDDITYDIALLNANGTLHSYLVNDTSSTTFTFDTTIVDDASYGLKAYASDASLTTTWNLLDVYSEGFTVLNTVPNNPITITNLNSVYNLTEGQTLNLNADYTDADNDTATFSCNRTDLFADFSTSLGTGSWTTVAGTYSVLLGVSDGQGSSDSQIVTINVAEQELIVPIITTRGNNVTNDESLEFGIDEFDIVALNVDATNANSYAWLVDSVDQSDSDNTFVWDSTGYSGSTNVTCIASNVNGTDQITFTIDVTPYTEDIIPEITSYTNNVTNNASTSFSVNNGTIINFSFVAENATSYNWLYGGESESHNFNNYTINTTGLSGTKTITAQAINANGTDVVNWMVVINDGSNAAPTFDDDLEDQTVNEGSTLSFFVIATDSDGDDLTYSSSELPDNAELDGYTFRFEPDYTQAGTYDITFYVTDGIANVSQSIEISVFNTNTGGGGSSGGSGTSVTTKYMGDEEPQSNLIYRERFTKKNVVEESSTTMDFKYPSEHQIESITYTALRSNQYVGVTIEKLKSPSLYTSGTPNANYVYSYVNILVYDDEYNKYTNNPTVTFNVPNEWMSENSITDITLYTYYDGEWVSCHTSQVSSSTGFKTYTAEVPDYGYFAITGGKKMMIVNTETLPNDFDEYAGRFEVLSETITEQYENVEDKIVGINPIITPTHVKIGLMTILIGIGYLCIKKKGKGKKPKTSESSINKETNLNPKKRPPIKRKRTYAEF
jgi:PGF-pre-PGF domain-containing protein